MTAKQTTQELYEIFVAADAAYRAATESFNKPNRMNDTDTRALIAETHAARTAAYRAYRASRAAQ